MGLSRILFALFSLLLIPSVALPSLPVDHMKKADRTHYVHRASSLISDESALADPTHPLMPINQIRDEDDRFDIASGLEISSDKINLAALKKTKLKLTLWGTITGNGVRAYAIIEEATEGEQKMYHVGETIQNAIIKMILREKVVLSVGGQYELLELETKKVDVNAKNKYGVTTLIDASYRGQQEQVEWLILEGADLNARDKQGDTALMKAAIKGHSEIVALLLENGADVHAKDNAGNTALIDASKYARESTSEVLSLIVDHGSEVNAKNNYGETALMNAARWGQTENVAFLIAEGADINAKTKSGETALKFAEFSAHKDVVELLKSHGAKE